MNAFVWLFGGLGMGWGLSQFLDPARGGRRRAQIRDKAISAAHVVGDAVDTTSRDVRNRTRGVIAELRARRASAPVSDTVLVERVRSRLGGTVRHPRAVVVTAHDGRVTLQGPILADEGERLLARVASIGGVREVDNRLDVHTEPGDVPGLQGDSEQLHQSPRWQFMQRNWSPTARLVGGGLGAALSWYGLKTSGVIGTAVGLSGLALLGRAVTNLEVSRLLGIGSGRRGIDIQKTITVNAPIDEVFGFWSNYENFPRFMSHVTQVQRADDGHAHWKVVGPAGLPIEFDTVETRHESYRCIAWKTVARAPVAHTGIVRFDRDGIDLRMSYNPLGGVAAHALASLFGADPKTAMDEDLVRLKSLLEDGRTRAHGEGVSRGELA
jgi:uncharacterized membrane protein